MARSFRHHPLPVKIALSGKKRFQAPLPGLPQLWTLKSGEEHFPSLELGTSSLPFQVGLGIKPGFREGSLSRFQPERREDGAWIIDFAWNWVEYGYRPLHDLVVQAVHWSPDLRVICGTLFLVNESDRERKIEVSFQPRSMDRGAPGGLSPARFNGRTILSGAVGNTWAGFLLAEGYLERSGTPTLTVSTNIPEGGRNAIHLAFAAGSSAAEVEDHLEQALRLDWDGELARQKVLQESRLTIETGDPQRDLLLASNQNLARRTFEHLFLKDSNSEMPPPALDSLQAWALYQSLFPMDGSDLQRFLDLLFPPDEQAMAQSEDPSPAEHNLPLKAALLWQVSQAGYSPEHWEIFLTSTESDLEKWFGPNLDQDGDGIPAIRFPGQLQITPAGQESNNVPPNYPTWPLEHPGLAALLANEISKLAVLRNLAGREPLPAIWDLRKDQLEKFILQSWFPPDGRFQSRESGTHTSSQGVSLVQALPSGWHSLGLDLPQPSRIMVRYQNLGANQALSSSRVVLHGRDINGRYRVEEIRHPLIDWEKKEAAAGTQSVFAHLDFISISGLEAKSQIALQVPSTDPRDISHLLPFWLANLDLEDPGESEEHTPRFLDDLVTELGLKSFSGPGPGPVHLTWNALAVWGLLQQGQFKLADEICQGWFLALGENYRISGNHLSVWDCSSGKSQGKENSAESALPIQLLLEAAGFTLAADGTVIYEPRGNHSREMRLSFQGAEIMVGPDQLRVARRGEEPFLLPRDGRQVIQLRISPSLNFSA